LSLALFFAPLLNEGEAEIFDRKEIENNLAFSILTIKAGCGLL